MFWLTYLYVFHALQTSELTAKGRVKTAIKIINKTSPLHCRHNERVGDRWIPRTKGQ